MGSSGALSNPLGSVMDLFGSGGRITGAQTAAEVASTQLQNKRDQANTQMAIAENDRKKLLEADRDKTRLSQKTQNLEQQGRAGTILTSPLGIVTGGATNNTLLGS